MDGSSPLGKKVDSSPVTSDALRNHLEAFMIQRTRGMEFLGTASDYAIGPMQDKMNQLDDAFSAEMEGECDWFLSSFVPAPSAPPPPRFDDCVISMRCVL